MSEENHDIRIVKMIATGGADAERGITALYDLCREMIINFVRKNNGNSAEAEDLLQDAIITVYEKIRAGKYERKSKLSTYVYSVARFTWLNYLKRKNISKRIIDNQDYAQIDPGILPKILQREHEDSVYQVVMQLGERCRKLLRYAIYEQYSTKEIVKLMGYENTQIVRNTKSRCLKQLREMIQANPNLLEILQPVDHGIT